MSNLYVPYEIALTLREKGFKGTTINNMYYHISYKKLYDYSYFAVFENMLHAPIYQEVTDWFRDKHNLHFYITPYGDMRTWSLSGLQGWEFPNVARIDKTERDDRLFYDVRQKYMDVKFNTYYEALEQAIREGLKLI